MKSAGRHIVKSIQSRAAYSAQAAAAHAEPTAATAPTVSRLPSGCVVASQEDGSPMSRLALFVRAGSRAEGPHDVGITHAIRTAAKLTNNRNTQFGLTRTLQQMGASLTVSTTREHTIYEVDCLRHAVDDAFDVLRGVALEPVYKPWEMDLLPPAIMLDVQQLTANPTAALMEGLHKAAFRDTLGRSLYMSANRVGTHTGSQMQKFIQANFSAPNVCCVGSGVDHDVLVFKMKQLTMGAGGATQKTATYHGGEERCDTGPGELAHAAIVTPGLTLSSKSSVSLALFQQLLGLGPRVKYSGGASGVLGAATAATGCGPHSVSALNASYSDAGLFGVHVLGQAADMHKLLPAAISAVRAATAEGAFTEADLSRAKSQLTASVLMSGEGRDASLRALGDAALNGDVVLSSADIITAVNAVTLEDVMKVGQAVCSGKASMAAVGDLSSTPYLDQLI